LEDLGYYVVDNLPPKMILPLVDMMLKSDTSVQNIATVIDIRSREYFADLNSVLAELDKKNVLYKIIFLEAEEGELVIRYEKVRRPHPLQKDGGSLLEAMRLESEILDELRRSASIRINTTGLSIHDFSRKLSAMLKEEGKRELKIHVMSFGFKYGLPIDAEFVADVRFLANPFWVDELKDKTGLDKEVSDYVFSTEKASHFLDLFTEMTTQTFDSFLHENKSNITIAFGCTGGHHRSVSMAEEYRNRLEGMGYSVSLTNRDVRRS
jgi:UPF0042 nucleotide-binding protein